MSPMSPIPPKNRPIRSLLRIAAFVCFAAFAPQASANYGADWASNPELTALWMVLKMPAKGGQWVYIPLGENFEIHKGFDATIRYVSECDEIGFPSGYAEEGIGISLELTDFTRDGNTLSFNMAVECRQIAKWQAQGTGYRPVFQTKSYRTTPETGPRPVQSGKWNCLIPGEDEDPEIPLMCIGPLILFLPD